MEAGKEFRDKAGHAREESFAQLWLISLFASVGNVVKILLRWVTWCRRAFVTVMPKRGKKGAVAEDGEVPKSGKRVK